MAKKLLLAALILWHSSHSLAFAADNSMIWALEKHSDTSYSARIGTQLPTKRDSQIGAEMRLRGPDPKSYGNPVALWGSVQLAERRATADIRSTRIDAWLDGQTGHRRITLNNSWAFAFPRMDIEARQEVVLSRTPASMRRANVNYVQSLTMISLTSRSEMTLTATKRNRDKWATSLKLKKPILHHWELSAELTAQGSKHTRSHFRAGYSFNW